MKKRILAALLCLCMVLSDGVLTLCGTAVDWLSSLAPEQETPVSVSVTAEGCEVNAITIGQDDEMILTASAVGFEAQAYQWQIRIDAENDTWVNIYDKTDGECRVSYALVQDVLEENKAFVRCRITDEDGVGVESAAVTVTIAEKAQEEAEAQAGTANTVSRAASAGSGEVMALSDEETETQTEEDANIYVITVEYVIYADDGEPDKISTSYTATVQSGASFVQNIVSPAYLGYAPWWNGYGVKPDPNAETKTEADTLALNIEKVTGDITITVYYLPIDVNYEVRIYIQNIYDDFYSEDSANRYTGSIQTGDSLENAYNAWIEAASKKDDNGNIVTRADELTGYTMMYYNATNSKDEKVAADGSTVINVYFDRNYYLMYFDCLGGYGTDPVYARYGTAIMVVDPVRSGYTFKGWDYLGTTGTGTGDGTADTLPSTVPTEDSYYQAIWEASNDVGYVVAFWAYDSNNEKYLVASVAATGTANAAVNATDKVTVNGTAYDSWIEYGLSLKDYLEEGDYAKANADESITIAGDGSSILNIYYVHKTYILRFYYARAEITGNKTTYKTASNTGGFGKYSSSDTYKYYKKLTADEKKIINIFKNWPTNQNEVDKISWNYESSTLPSVTFSEDLIEKYGIVGVTYTTDDGESKGELKYSFYTSNNTEYRYYYFDITAKYGADISAVWPTAVSGKSGSMGTNGSAYFVGWNGQFGIGYHEGNENPVMKGRYRYLDENLILDGDLVDESIYTENGTTVVSYLAFYYGGTYRYDYKLYTEIASGTAPEKYDSTYIYNGTTYYYKLEDSFSVYATAGVSYQTIVELDGYTCIYPTKNGNALVWSGLNQDDFKVSSTGTDHTLTYYYNKDTNIKLTWVNKGAHEEESVTFQQDMTTTKYGGGGDGYGKEPTYPSSLETDAYVFAGWYTDENFTDRYKFVGNTMDSSDLVLYAKWVEKDRQVIFFESLSDMEAYQAGDTSVTPHATGKVKHGSTYKIDDLSDKTMTDAEGKTLYFNGWYYLENGAKKRFYSENTPVKSDLMVYADWTSDVKVNFTIQYVTYVLATVAAEKGYEYASIDENGDPILYSPSGKWTVNEKVDLYERDDDKGTYVMIKVADDTTGQANVGSTRTFTAKGGRTLDQLYSDFNDSGYLPMVASHSMVISIKPEDNVYVFEYRVGIPVDYTVNYVNKVTGVAVHDSYTAKTSYSVITVKYQVVPDYVPDSYYRTLVLSLDPSYNIITFYYTANTQKIVYGVRYLQQTLTSTNATNYGIFSNSSTDADESYQELGNADYKMLTSDFAQGTVDKTATSATVEAPTYTGFTASHALVVYGEYTDTNKGTVVTPNEDGTYSIPISAEDGSIDATQGVVLYIFYTRNYYGYTIQYLKYGTKDKVRDSVEVNDENGTKLRYGATLTATAETLEGYTCVSATTQSIEIVATEGKNVITFYYSPKQYTIEYVAVAENAPSDILAGLLTRSLEVLAYDAEVSGSTPNTSVYFEFEGWYTDEACTKEAENIVDEDNKITPVVSALSDTETNYFYAKFTPIYGNMKIAVTDGANDYSAYGFNQQVFVFAVTFTWTEEVMYVTVTGDAEVWIYAQFGQYTVTQMDDWSWRYTAEQKYDFNFNVDKATVTFTETLENSSWLSGNSGVEVNTYGGGGA